MFIKKQQILDPWKFLTIEQELNWIQAFKCCEKNNNFTLHVSKDSNHMVLQFNHSYDFLDAIRECWFKNRWGI